MKRKPRLNFICGRKGLTEEEVKAVLDLHLVELAEWKAKVLADVRKWLGRGGEQLH